MADIVDQLKKILAMTTSSDIEEARTAAMLFCKRIRDYGIELVLPGHDAQDDAEDVDDFFFRHVRNQPPFQPKASPWERWNRPPPPPPQPPPPPPAPPKPPHAYRKPKFEWPPVHITAKHSDSCKQCGKMCNAGDKVFWRRKHGITHDTKGCEAFWWVEQKQQEIPF